MGKFYSVSFVNAYEDQRGAVVYPFRDLGVDPSEMKNMHVASIAPGEARGNHLHPAHEEYVLVAGMEVMLSLVSPDGAVKTIAVGPEPSLVTIHPGVAHVFKNEGDYPCFLTCWYSGAGDEIRTETRRIID